MEGPQFRMPNTTLLIDDKGNISFPYGGLLTTLTNTVFGGTRSGTSTERPTSKVSGRYIGMSYFDTSLGLPIYLQTATPYASSDVWVRYDGTPV